MREALRGLTTRGRSFLAAAAAALIASLILGERDLLRVAVLLAALPLLSAAYVGPTRYRLSCSRTLAPHRVQVGASARAILRLPNLPPLPTGPMPLGDRRSPPGIPPRRRPAPREVELDRPRRRAHGPPRGAALGEVGDRRARDVGHRAPGRGPDGELRVGGGRSRQRRGASAPRRI